MFCGAEVVLLGHAALGRLSNQVFDCSKFTHSQSGVWKPSESLGQMKGGDVTQVARAEGRQLQVPEALISVCSLGDVLKPRLLAKSSMTSFMAEKLQSESNN